MANLKAASVDRPRSGKSHGEAQKNQDGSSMVITFPASSAQKWVLPDGLTLMVQEDGGAPVASVQAWCNTASIFEDENCVGGLLHVLDHMLCKDAKTQAPN